MFPGQHPADSIAYKMATSGREISYGELEAASNQAAHLFRSEKNGGTAGGIAILLPNHELYLKIAWAAQRSGLYFTPISILFQKAEIDYILTNSDARVLITSASLINRVSESVLAGLNVYLVDVPDGQFEQFEEYEQFEHAISRYPTTRIMDECEGAEMIYSSGTTGQPKGVRFELKKAPLGSVSELLKKRVALHGIDSSVRYLSTAPMYHSAPLRYNLMVTRFGGTAIIMEKFDPEEALALIEAHHITHSQWVPTMFVRLLKLPPETRTNYDISSLRYVIHAAAPCPIPVKEQMIDWVGPILYEYYSGTEANGSTAIDSTEWLTHKGSVGRAIHGEIHILDEAGFEVPNYALGTVYFARGSDFSYYKDPEKTANAKNEKGWSTLGDIGYVDDEGYLYLTDRKSFMIISGGVNIYPQEIENLLVTHPLVADVAVIGVPNEEFGEEVKAVVELLNANDAGPATERTLIDFCRAHISHVKCPRSIDFSDSLPRHPTGKLYKRKLREKYWRNES